MGGLEDLIVFDEILKATNYGDCR